MRILIVGKYPPIEGGVSARTYWLARGLGEQGHHVSIATNAGRVEEEYRIALNTHSHDPLQRALYQPGNVSLFSLTNPAPAHIPYSESFVTRLVNSGLRAIEQYGADVIYAYYLEPYGMAGMVLKDLTGIPLVVRHAGSDIFQLLRNSDMSLALSRVLQRADQVILDRPLFPMARRLGISPARVSTIKGPAPSDMFTPEGARFEFPSSWDMPEGVPVIGYMGKAGRSKGMMEMLDALSVTTMDFRYVVVSKGRLVQDMKNRIAGDPALEGKVFFLDFMPPWRVPSFLRSLDLYVQLENRFGVPIHMPIQSHEALLCGTPALLSRDMQRKIKRMLPTAHSQLPVVEDPRDVAGLAATLTTALKDIPSLRAVAQAARAELRSYNTWDAYMQDHLDAFNRARSPFARLFRSRRWRVRGGGR